MSPKPAASRPAASSRATDCASSRKVPNHCCDACGTTYCSVARIPVQLDHAGKEFWRNKDCRIGRTEPSGLVEKRLGEDDASDVRIVESRDRCATVFRNAQLHLMRLHLVSRAS